MTGLETTFFIFWSAVGTTLACGLLALVADWLNLTTTTAISGILCILSVLVYHVAALVVFAKVLF